MKNRVLNRVLSLALVLFLSLPAGYAQAQERILPHWSSDQILAKRPTGPQDALSFKFETLHQEADKADTLTTAKVRLWDGFDSTASEDSETITDYQFCRVFQWRRMETTFNHTSCYADPAFRVIELYNRFYLRDIMDGAAAMADDAAKKGKPVRKTPDFWLEQEMGVQVKKSTPLAARQTPKGVEWRLVDEVAVFVSAEGVPIAVTDRQRIARFLSGNLQLHPQVRKAILESGTLPLEIQVHHRGLGAPSKDVYRLSEFSRVQERYPLPANLTSNLYRLSEGNTPAGRMWRAGLNAATGANGAKRPTFDALLQQMKDAAARKSALETTLTFYKIIQVYFGALERDPALMERLREAVAEVMPYFGTGEAVPLVKANDLAGDAGKGPEREASARFLMEATKLDKLDFGTYRLMTFSNLVNTTEDVDTWAPEIRKNMPSREDALYQHIAAEPWGSNAYFDLGSSRYGEFNPWEAWQIWDLGRAVDPDWPATLMSGVSNLEARIRADQPDRF